MVNCTMSKLRHPKKCYVQNIGFSSVPEGRRIIQPYISKWFTASIGIEDLIYYQILNGLGFSYPWQQPEWSSKIGSVYPYSAYPSICPGVEIALLVLSKFWHGARNLYEVVRDSRILWKNIFVPKIGKMDQKWPKNGFFEIIVKLGS